jgi:outer membrane protein insertion porin family
LRKKTTWLWVVACIVLQTSRVLALEPQPLRTWGKPDEQEEPEASAEALENTREAPTKAPVPAKAPDELDAAMPTTEVEIEGVDLRGNSATLDSVILRFVPFARAGSRAGLARPEVVSVDDPRFERLRWQLLATGYFREVALSLRKGASRGKVRLVISVVEQTTFTLNDVWLGLSATASPDGTRKPLTAYGGIDVTEHNLGGTGVSLGGAVAVAERQLGLRARFGDRDFLRSGFGLDALLLHNRAKETLGFRNVSVLESLGPRRTDTAPVAYGRFGAQVGLSHSFAFGALHGFADYRIEAVETESLKGAVEELGGKPKPVDFFLRPERSLVSSLRTTWVLDTRDSPSEPRAGNHFSVFAEIAPSLLGSDYPFVKLTGRAMRWTPLPWGRHVLRAEAFAGAILGAAPLFDRFYVADFSDFLPDRPLELSVDRRPVPNFLGTNQGDIQTGTYAARLSLEYLVPIYEGRTSILSVNAFASAGVFSVFSARDLERDDVRGVRQIPLDLTANFGLRIRTSLGPVSLGLSTLLFFLPVRAEAKP